MSSAWRLLIRLAFTIASAIVSAPGRVRSRAIPRPAPTLPAEAVHDPGLVLISKEEEYPGLYRCPVCGRVGTRTQLSSVSCSVESRITASTALAFLGTMLIPISALGAEAVPVDPSLGAPAQILGSISLYWLIDRRLAMLQTQLDDISRKVKDQ